MIIGSSIKVMAVLGIYTTQKVMVLFGFCDDGMHYRLTVITDEIGIQSMIAVQELKA